MIKQNKKQIPAIISDVDGVLLLGKTAIPKVKEVIQSINTPLKNIDKLKFDNDDFMLPFYLFTNRGGIIEKDFCAQININLNLNKNQIQAEQSILNYTPFKHLFEDYKDEIILLVGRDRLIQPFGQYYCKKFVTIEEYCILFPYLVPNSQLRSEEIQKQTKAQIKQRLNLADQDFEYPFQIKAIFILTTPNIWEESLQIILDLVATSDGKILKKSYQQQEEENQQLQQQQQQSEIGPEKHIPIYASFGDIAYTDVFQLPRMLVGCFLECLKTLHLQMYKKPIQIEMYGKPEKVACEYIEKYVKQTMDNNHEISHFYMIGDNPTSDIKGANQQGWISILVRTGYFKGEGNSDEEPAKYVVNNFYEAVQLIFKLEDIKSEEFDNI